MKTFLTTIMFLIPFFCGAQTVSFGQSKEEEVFLYEVKTIDEFIERFNDDSTSFIRQELKKQGYPENVLNRPLLLYSLFNGKNAALKNDTAIKHSFFKQVLNPQAPLKLRFSDTAWFVQAQCFFSDGSKTLPVPLTLRVHTEKNGGAKWMICGVGDSPLLTEVAMKRTAMVKADSDIIYPTAHAVDFVVFRHVFNDTMNELNYFEPATLTTKNAQALVGNVKNKKLKFEYANAIRFYFFQVPGYSFAVQQFNRQEANSGWLINVLKRSNAAEKQREIHVLMQGKSPL